MRLSAQGKPRFTKHQGDAKPEQEQRLPLPVVSTCLLENHCLRVHVTFYCEGHVLSAEPGPGPRLLSSSPAIYGAQHWPQEGRRQSELKGHLQHETEIGF